jgi:hypothetical protein
MTDHELIKRLSTIGSQLIGLQLDLGSTPRSKITKKPWVLGYCFGFIDAICQAMELDQYTDGMLLMTVTLDIILGGDDLKRGASALGIALEKQTNSIFQDGVARGGTDFMNWRSDSNNSPMGLARRAD